MIITIKLEDEIDAYRNQIRSAAEKTVSQIRGFEGEPLDLLQKIKFDQIGQHPTENHDLNLIEQINQTWTYLVALSAAQILLPLFPESEGLKLAPGAKANLPCDIMGINPGIVAAEIFAAVDPKNNNKLSNDIGKLKKRSEMNRFVFFMSPGFAPGRQLALESDQGVQVWAVDAYPSDKK